MKTILLISPYWKEPHRWMVSSVKLSELWQRMGYTVVVACMGSKTKTERISDTLIVHSYKDVFIPDPWNYGICIGFSGKAKKLAREINPDVIIVNKILFWTSFSLLSLRRAGYNVILLTDALVGMTWWPRHWIAKTGAYIYAHTFGKRIMKRASRIVFFHPQPDDLLRKLKVHKKSEVIPTGIDPKKYRSKKEDNQQIVVSYIGRLESVKGVDDLLMCAREIVKDFEHAVFHVIGWHEKNNAIVKRFAARRIQFLGLRENIPHLLYDTDIFVLPSYSEGLSNALMEAMSSACACIASDVGGNRFLIENRTSGLLFPAGDRDVLLRQLRQLVGDHNERKLLGKNARKRIEEHFSWDILKTRYEELFARVPSRNEL